MHVGRSGDDRRPYLDSDEVDMEDIDILFIRCGLRAGCARGTHGRHGADRASGVCVCVGSHFHLDHAASVPYLTERTTFKGRIFATHPTKAVMKLLLSDYIRVRGAAARAAPARTHLTLRLCGGGRGVFGEQVSGAGSTDTQLYTEQQLNSCINKIETADFLQVGAAASSGSVPGLPVAG